MHASWRYRTASKELHAYAVSMSGVVQVYTPDKLNQLMADSDYVVMALPYTQSTHHLVNAEAINAMRPNGVLINVGRGKTLEQDAIIKGLCTDLSLASIS
jgi:phosphoglycerate dehydrogenase-like enzyme